MLIHSHNPRYLLTALNPLRSVSPEKRGWVRSSQIKAFKRLLPAVALANTANALLLVIVLWRTPQHAFLEVWCGIISLVSSLPLLARSMRGAKPEPAVRSPQAVRRVERDSALLAALWAVMVLVVFPPATLMQKMIIAVVVVGMMCGGSFMLATVGTAAFAFSGLLCAASAAVLLMDGRPSFIGLALLLLSYFGVLVAGVKWIGNLYVVQLMAKEEAREKSSLVGDLLHDFESDASDWLWRMDAQHGIINPSDRFASVLGVAPDVLAGENLFNRLRAGPEAEALRAALESGQAFRDVEVPLEVEGVERWISFTGHPARDGRLQGRRGVASDITEQRAAAARISFLALNDPLTGLPNRLALFRRLEDELKTTCEPAGGLIFIDLDHFKTINDTLGHSTGDALLAVVAERLKVCAPPQALVGRLGGDEFAVILPSPTTGSEIESVGAKILSALHEPFVIGQRKVFSGASLGMRFFSAGDKDPSTLMKHADLALYAAKAKGRGRAQTFEVEMERALQERADIERGLRNALKRDEFRLFLQPFYDATTSSVRGCEALIRWQHPEFGLTSPGRFIEVAEQAGLMDDIGLWVIGEALRQMRILPEPLSVAVNVSATQLTSRHFLPEVLRTLAQSQVDPSRLEIEITESALFDGSGHNLETLRNLAATGIRIALDDFGTGFSSLSHLRLFPFDKIKIDQSFVRHMTEREDCRSIVNAISGLASSLQMTTTAEGVETAAQLDLVRKAGCGYVQGYFYSRPVTLDELLVRCKISSVAQQEDAPKVPVSA